VIARFLGNLKQVLIGAERFFAVSVAPKVPRRARAFRPGYLGLCRKPRTIFFPPNAPIV
jgi:hypothetical protein